MTIGILNDHWTADSTGFLFPKDGAAYDVVIGDTSMSGGGEKLRVVGNTLIEGTVDVDIAAAHLRLGLVAGSGPGSAAEFGTVRYQDDFFTAFRDALDANDITALAADGADNLVVGGTLGGGLRPLTVSLDGETSSQLRHQGSDRFIALATTCQVSRELRLGGSANIIRFEKNLTTPLIEQRAGDAAAEVGELFTTHSQDETGTGATVGGARLDRAGDATGADANTGGAYDLRAGEHGSGGGTGGLFTIRQPDGTAILQVDDTGFAAFGVPPVPQPSSTGETVGFTAGVGTGVNDDSTFTGNVGATAYRLSDVVKHLKNVGYLAA